MAANGKQTRASVGSDHTKIITWLNALEDSELNDWERNFLESIYDQYETRGKMLTPNQYDALERMYRKYY